MEIKFKAPGGEQLRQLALPLAVLLGLLALWFAWSGASQWRDQQRESALTAARDGAALAVGSAVKTQAAQLGKLLATPAVATALSPPPMPAPDEVASTPTIAMPAAPAADFAALAAALKAAWPK